MAMTNSTQVKFVEVATRTQYNQYANKTGVIFFIRGDKKIVVDGIEYGVNDSDISGFLKKTGGTMSGNLNMGDNDIDNVSVLDTKTLNLEDSAGVIRGQLTATNSGIFFTIGDEDLSYNYDGQLMGIRKVENGTDATNKSYVDTAVNAVDSKVNTTTSELGQLKLTIGSPDGIATLDTSGKVPSSQLPSYVDDLQEYASQSAFPTTGESDKIYVAKDTNRIYRWSGSAYVQIASGNLVLGTTSSTAYRGDRGQLAYNHISTTNNPHSVTKSQVGLGSVQNYGVASSSEAQAGTASNKYMTPKTTKEAVIKFSPILTWTVVS